MKRKRIAIIQGHPDQVSQHYCHAIAQAYKEGATNNGHIVQTFSAATLSRPFLVNQSEFISRDLDASVLNIQGLILWADHIVIIYPLWLGTMPAILKHFFEQVFRPSFAFFKPKNKKWPKKLLKDKSVRIVVTMGMPAIVYRWFFHAHSLKSLEKNILSFVGFTPVHHSLIGQIDSTNDKHRIRWLKKVRKLGEACI